MKTAARKYWYNLMISFDQLGNAIAGGNPDCTISARIGYNVHESSNVSNFWILMEMIVDWTFKPIDGPNHCLQAYNADKSEEFYGAGKDWIKVCLMWIIVTFCTPISIIIRIGKMRKKKTV